MKKVFEEGETIEYAGKCVVHLAAGRKIQLSILIALLKRFHLQIRTLCKNLAKF